MIEKQDCTYQGWCEKSQAYIVCELLYPESCGWRERWFKTESAARAWMDSLPLPGDDPAGL